MVLILACLLFIPIFSHAEDIRYDPTTPISPETPILTEFDAQELTLQAIFASSRQPFAIINGMRVEEHQKIGNFTVIAITRENVQLQGENGIVILPLVKQTVIK